MNRKQIRSMLEEIETTFPVIHWKINDIHIWPILRTIIVFSKYTSENPSQTKSYSANNQNWDGNLEWLNHEVDAVLLTNRGTKAQLGEIQYDRLCDPIIEGLNGEKINTLLIRSHQIENLSEKNFTESIDIYKYLNNHHIAKYDKSVKDNVHRLPEMFAFLQDKYDIEGLNLPSLRIMMNRIRYKADFFKMLLSRVSAKIGFVVCYYREDGYAFCLACNELGIPSVDIQHGVQGDFHFAYGGWNAVPENGFEVMPTAFWCWSEYEKETIEKWGRQIHRAFIGGNPWLEMWKDNHSKLVLKYDKIIKNEHKSDELNILLTLQPLYGLPGWKANIPTWVLDAIKLSPNNWRWYVRMHPQMIDGGYVFESENTIVELKKHGLLEKVEFKLATDLPLPSLLRHMDVHATAHSSCIIEAEHFGVPSIVLHENGVLGYPKQIETGWALPAFNKEQLLQAINEQYSKKQNEVKTSSMTDQNIMASYNEIIAKSTDHFKKREEALFTKLAYIDVLFIEQKYETIINEFRLSEHPVIERYVAKSYEAMGILSEAIKINKKYIEKLSIDGVDETNDVIFHIYELISIADLFEVENIDKEEVDKIIIDLLQEINDISQLLKMLFDRGDYHWVVTLVANFKNQNHLDVLFYKGRALKCLNNWQGAINCLKNFIKKYDELIEMDNFLTFQRNYLLSTYFHLGECYMELVEEEKCALECFQKCLDFSNDKHRKAKEYVRLLEGNFLNSNS